MGSSHCIAIKDTFLRITDIVCVFISFLARGRTNIELREKFILPEGASQGMTPFRSRGRRSKPSSRAASPTRSSSSASQSNHSCTSMPSSPATPASGTKVRTDLHYALLPHSHPHRCSLFTVASERLQWGEEIKIKMFCFINKTWKYTDQGCPIPSSTQIHGL